MLCTHDGESHLVRFLRWLKHPMCSRCWHFTFSCGEHWFCDLCPSCREYYESTIARVRPAGNPSGKVARTV